MESDEDRAKYHAIMDWYDLERRKKGIDLGPIIRERLADRDTDAERIALLQVLAWELVFRDKFAEAADTLLEWAAMEPLEPMPLISLAGQRVYHEDNPQRALADIDRTIVLAEASGKIRRHALNTKVRILTKLKD